MTSDAPQVFVSYSHDNESHKEWVRSLAEDLIKYGIDATLDQWDLKPGQDLAQFMEQGVTNADRVIVVCTDNYNEKSNGGVGGAGYEKQILTSELLRNQNTTKFIPIIRNVEAEAKAPICLSTRSYIDFSEDANYQNCLEELLRSVHEKPRYEKPKLGKNPFSSDVKKKPQAGDAASFFYDRFTSAFPGVRGIEWFEDAAEAIKRLKILLKEPLVFEDSSPIWWWRNGELSISVFEQMDAGSVLMGVDEFDIKKIAAINTGSYYQTYVYVETNPSVPTGLYPNIDVESCVDTFGYAWEEYGDFNGLPILRSHYDDGATIIDGEPVDLEGKANLRVRYITPYNFIIAAQNSPINNSKFDSVRQKIMNQILTEETSLEDFNTEFMKLPKCNNL